MDPASTHSIPPLLGSITTEQITLTYAGTNVNRGPFHTVAPIRSANTGQFSIYCSQFSNVSRVVIAVSFEEDDLPILDRQVYYHYLEGEDSISITDCQVAFTMNNNPSTKPDTHQVYTKALVWRINFAPNEFGPLCSLLKKINMAGGHWRQLSPISSLPADEQSVIYYNLRAALIEQPMPPQLGKLGTKYHHHTTTENARNRMGHPRKVPNRMTSHQQQASHPTEGQRDGEPSQGHTQPGTQVARRKRQRMNSEEPQDRRSNPIATHVGQATGKPEMHPQHQLPGGTSSRMSEREAEIRTLPALPTVKARRATIAQLEAVIKKRLEDTKAPADQPLARRKQAAPRRPQLWRERNNVDGSDTSMSEPDEDEDEDRSRTAVEEGNTSGGTPLNSMDDHSGNSQQQQPHVAQGIANPPCSHMADQFDNSRELREFPHHGRISHSPPPPIGSMDLPIRTEEPQSEDKVWMVAVVHPDEGKVAAVQLVMSQETAR
jgi:hypothetical protein